MFTICILIVSRDPSWYHSSRNVPTLKTFHSKFKKSEKRKYSYPYFMDRDLRQRIPKVTQEVKEEPGIEPILRCLIQCFNYKASLVLIYL